MESDTIIAVVESTLCLEVTKSDSGVLELGVRSEVLGLGMGIDVLILDARTRMGVVE